MQTEFNLTGRKKDAYPSKTTLNLYYAEDRTTRPSTIALYVLFIAVIALACAKVLIFDMTAELMSRSQEVKRQEALVDEQMVTMGGYGDVKEEYGRYTFSYLTEDEKICDRLEILDMLEETVFPKVNLKSVVIMEYVVAVEFDGPNMEETAGLLQALEEYDIVDKVEVSTASWNDSYSTTMMITLTGGDAS